MQKEFESLVLLCFKTLQTLPHAKHALEYHVLAATKAPQQSIFEHMVKFPTNDYY